MYGTRRSLLRRNSSPPPPCSRSQRAPWRYSAPGSSADRQTSVSRSQHTNDMLRMLEQTLTADSAEARTAGRRSADAITPWATRPSPQSFSIALFGPSAGRSRKQCATAAVRTRSRASYSAPNARGGNQRMTPPFEPTMAVTSVPRGCSPGCALKSQLRVLWIGLSKASVVQYCNRV